MGVAVILLEVGVIWVLQWAIRDIIRIRRSIREGDAYIERMGRTAKLATQMGIMLLTNDVHVCECTYWDCDKCRATGLITDRRVWVFGGGEEWCSDDGFYEFVKRYHELEGWDD